MNNDSDTKVRTCRSHPLFSDSVLAPGGGQIGMTLCPGRTDDLSDKRWRRDLGTDFNVIVAWSPDLMLTLMESREFSMLGVPHFAEACARQVAQWRPLPIRDGGVPDQPIETAWKTVGDETRDTLTSGGRVLIHCRAGLGRTGMMAARLLVELGLSPDDAIATVRSARPRTIETIAQELHVRSQCRIV